MKERIYQIMQSENLTQREFAQALGISPSSLSSIFNGHTSPTNYTVQAIHKKFPSINVAWLMFGEGDMFVQTGAADADQSGALNLQQSRSLVRQKKSRHHSPYLQRQVHPSR